MKNIILILILNLFTLISFSQTSEEFEMIKVINKIRTNPKSFVVNIEDYISFLKNKKADNEIILECKKLVSFIKNQKSLKPLDFNIALYYIVTKPHAHYLDSTNQIGHISINGEQIWDRAKKMGLNKTTIGKSYGLSENCANVNNKSINVVLIQLLLDYGSVDKGHRKAILNDNAIQIAVARCGNVWLQNFIYIY